MFERLKEKGFEIEFRSHAEAILGADFPEVAEQLEGVLLSSTVPIEEIIGSGGGEAKGTQRLRNALAAHGWRKHNFVVQRIIDGVVKEAQSHEIDHVKTFAAGTNSCNSWSRLGPSSAFNVLTPVMLLPGRFTLATSPSSTASKPP